MEVKLSDRVMHTGDSTRGVLVVESIEDGVAVVSDERGDLYTFQAWRLAPVVDWAQGYIRQRWRALLKERLKRRSMAPSRQEGAHMAKQEVS